jgi:hypothetical protein
MKSAVITRQLSQRRTLSHRLIAPQPLQTGDVSPPPVPFAKHKALMDRPLAASQTTMPRGAHDMLTART